MFFAAVFLPSFVFSSLIPPVVGPIVIVWHSAWHYAPPSHNGVKCKKTRERERGTHRHIFNEFRMGNCALSAGAHSFDESRCAATLPFLRFHAFAWNPIFSSNFVRQTLFNFKLNNVNFAFFIIIFSPHIHNGCSQLTIHNDGADTGYWNHDTATAIGIEWISDVNIDQFGQPSEYRGMSCIYLQPTALRLHIFIHPSGGASIIYCSATMVLCPGREQYIEAYRKWRQTSALLQIYQFWINISVNIFDRCSEIQYEHNKGAPDVASAMCKTTMYSIPKHHYSHSEYRQDVSARPTTRLNTATDVVIVDYSSASSNCRVTEIYRSATSNWIILFSIPIPAHTYVRTCSVAQRPQSSFSPVKYVPSTTPTPSGKWKRCQLTNYCTVHTSEDFG